MISQVHFNLISLTGKSRSILKAAETVSCEVSQGSILGPLLEAYLELFQTSKMERFAKRVNGIKPLNIFTKRCFLDV